MHGDEADDLVTVAVLDRDLVQLAARDHVQVALYRDAQGIETDLPHQSGDGDAGEDSAVLAIDDDCYCLIDLH